MDDIFSMSDEELLREAVEDGIDVAAEGAVGRQAFERAQLKAGKSKLERIRTEMSETKKTVVAIDTKTARSEVQAILLRNKEAAGKLTIAARNQSGDVDDDLDGLAEDFIELGAIKGGTTEEESE